MGEEEMEITEECFVEGFKEKMEEKDPGIRKNGGNKVKINEQDRELFELLLFQKFLDLQLIVKRFDPGEFPIKKGKTPRIYHRLYRLVKEGFLRNVKAKQSLLYLLNERGLREIRGKVNLPLVTLSEVSAVDHDLEGVLTLVEIV